MLTKLRKAAMAGVGLAEQIEEMIEALARKGEESQSERARRVRAFFESAQGSEGEWGRKMDDLFGWASQRMNLPSRADIERLRKELGNFAAKLNAS
ncbi:MAG TPA: hypothetical protein VIK48_02740 [Candidatus Manganitrophaceae bacterium]